MKYLKISLFFILAAFFTTSATFVGNKEVKIRKADNNKITLKERLTRYVNYLEAGLHKQESQKMTFFGKVIFKVQKAGVNLTKKLLAGDSLVLALVLCWFLGWAAIHRLYLGGTPLLILGYVFTAGGFFGILPIIDFIAMIIDLDHYIDNDQFFGFF